MISPADWLIVTTATPLEVLNVPPLEITSPPLAKGSVLNGTSSSDVLCGIDGPPLLIIYEDATTEPLGTRVDLIIRVLEGVGVAMVISE